LLKLGCLFWSVHIGFSSWGVQVGAFCEFLVSTFQWSKPPHHVKVNPLGEVATMHVGDCRLGVRIPLSWQSGPLSSFFAKVMTGRQITSQDGP
jgi:hypothetical protein